MLGWTVDFKLSTFMTCVCCVVAQRLYSQCGFGLSCVITISLSLFPAQLENKTNFSLMAHFSLSFSSLCLFLPFSLHALHLSSPLSLVSPLLYSFPISILSLSLSLFLCLCCDVVDQNEWVRIFGSLNHMRRKHSQLLYNAHTNTHTLGTPPKT